MYVMTQAGQVELDLARRHQEPRPGAAHRAAICLNPPISPRLVADRAPGVDLAHRTGLCDAVESDPGDGDVGRPVQGRKRQVRVLHYPQPKSCHRRSSPRSCRRERMNWPSGNDQSDEPAVRCYHSRGPSRRMRWHSSSNRRVAVGAGCGPMCSGAPSRVCMPRRS